ncbi:MAG TPA: nucleotidyltransferase domain-containing protein [Bradyrhizobium sp.]
MQNPGSDAGVLFASKPSNGNAVPGLKVMVLAPGFYAKILAMDKQQILERLRENESALRERGVTHAALFGSRARGDNRPDSDIDIMIDIAPDAVRDVYTYVGLKNYIAALFPGTVDVVDREALKPYVRPAATADAVYAF